MFLNLAWRNLWRNKRRTLIAAASVFFAVFLALLMRSAQQGSYSYMIDSSVRLYTGHARLVNHDHPDNPSLETSFIIPDSLIHQIASTPGVEKMVCRLETIALVSSDTLTQVAQVIGIEPQPEAEFTRLDQRLTDGRFLQNDDDAALIGHGLAEMLNVTVGDTLVIYGQGFQGVTAADRLPICGLVRMPFEAMDNSLVFTSLTRSQELFSAGNRLTSLAILLQNVRQTALVQLQINYLLKGSSLIWQPWNEMLPELEQNIMVDNAGGLLMLGILYIVILFGMLGTVMMMAAERSREFSILISIGMKPRRLIMVTALEGIGINLLGLLSGSVSAWPLLVWLSQNPIPISGAATKTFDSLGIEPVFNFSASPDLFLTQLLIILGIAMVISIYPLIHISRMNPLQVLRS